MVCFSKLDNCFRILFPFFSVVYKLLRFYFLSVWENIVAPACFNFLSSRPANKTAEINTFSVSQYKSIIALLCQSSISRQVLRSIPLPPVIGRYQG